MLTVGHIEMCRILRLFGLWSVVLGRSRRCLVPGLASLPVLFSFQQTVTEHEARHLEPVSTPRTTHEDKVVD